MENETEKKGLVLEYKNVIIKQGIILLPAFIISIVGIVTSLGAGVRLTIYAVQTLLCIVMAGCCILYQKRPVLFKYAIYFYAFLQTLRAALLQTQGVELFPSACAKALMIISAMLCILLSERLNKKKDSICISAVIAACEVLLYVVFLVGFPAVRTSRLYIVFPLSGILVAVSLLITIIGIWKVNSNRSEESEN